MSVTAVPLQPVKSSYKVWLWLGIIAAIAAAFGLAWVGTGQQRALKGSNEQFLAWNKKGQIGVHTTASGLEYQILKPGSGPTPSEGDGVAVTVSGKRRDGSIFQPSAPLQFLIGQPMVPGFTELAKLMSKGAHYRAWLPPKLGYGASPDGPAELKNDVLIFDVEMQELVPAEQIRAMRQQQMQQQLMQQGGAQRGGPPPGVEGQGPPPGAEGQAPPQ